MDSNDYKELYECFKEIDSIDDGTAGMENNEWYVNKDTGEVALLLGLPRLVNTTETYAVFVYINKENDKEFCMPLQIFRKYFVLENKYKVEHNYPMCLTCKYSSVNNDDSLYCELSEDTTESDDCCNEYKSN